MNILSEGTVHLERIPMEHVADRRMTAAEHHAYISMLMMADIRTGTWRGSSVLLTELLGYGSKNTMAKALEGLEEKGYILRDFVAGRPGSFSILLDKSHIREGANAGNRVDLAGTKRGHGIPDGKLCDALRKSLGAAISVACAFPVVERSPR